MCNDYGPEVDIASLMEDFGDLKINIGPAQGTSNVAARDDIKINDVASFVCTAARGRGELAKRRERGPGQKAGSVYNFRARGRRRGFHRRPILADGRSEFTDSEARVQKRGGKSIFTMADLRWLCITGISDESRGSEGFRMLALDGGKDNATCHYRHIVPLPRDRRATWLDPTARDDELPGILQCSLLPVRSYPQAPAQAALP